MGLGTIGLRFDPYAYCKNAEAAGKAEKTEAPEAKQAAEKNPSGQKFADKDELMDYLKEHYKIVAGGSAQISGSYLNRCLNDENELQRLFENLDAADEALERAPDEIRGFQGMNIVIDESGDMKTSSSGGWVSVNVGKRVRQITAAKTPAQIQMVLSMLDTDLSQIKDGKARGMSDDDEIAKVEALIQQARQRASEIGAQNEEELCEAEKDMGFYTTLLM